MVHPTYMNGGGEGELKPLPDSLPSDGEPSGSIISGSPPIRLVPRLLRLGALQVCIC